MQAKTERLQDKIKKLLVTMSTSAQPVNEPSSGLPGRSVAC
jgi:hypothetical protein